MRTGTRENHAYFTRRMFLHAVLPAPLAGIGLALAEMGDTILVSHAIGMDGLAAIGYLSPLFFTASFLLFGLSMGGAIVYSNLLNEGKEDEALGTFNFFLRLAALAGFGIAAGGLLFQDGLLSLLGADPEDSLVYAMSKSYAFFILLGIPFEILMGVLCAYLRNDDATNLSVAIQTASGLGNIAISAVLLFGCGWGVAGCSFGFLLSNLSATLVAAGYILLRKGGKLAFRPGTIPWRAAVKPLRLGFATSSEYIFGAFFALTAIHLLMDLIGTDGVAVFNVIENLSLLFIFLYELIGKTSQPLFSTFFAECNFTELHRLLRYALAYSLLIGVLATALVILCPSVLDLLFSLEGAEDAALVCHAARIFCLGTIFMGISLLLQNYLQSEEDESGAFLVVFLRQCGVAIPLAFCTAQFGFYAFWLVYPLAEIITLLLLFAWKRGKGERRRVAPERVHASSFSDGTAELACHLQAIGDFAAAWGADSGKCHTLLRAVEELCSLLQERTKEGEELLTQLTVIALEDGTFELHLRTSGAAFDPFLSLQAGEEQEADPRPLLLQLVRTRARQFLYRNYHGFNTLMISI